MKLFLICAIIILTLKGRGHGPLDGHTPLLYDGQILFFKEM